jgi:hypothetical protein
MVTTEQNTIIAEVSKRKVRESEYPIPETEQLKCKYAKHAPVLSIVKPPAGA